MDLKEMYMERAEELAMKLYGVEFYELGSGKQDLVWKQAEEDVINNCADQADNLRKA